jgi:hypothetical protein
VRGRRRCPADRRGQATHALLAPPGRIAAAGGRPHRARGSREGLQLARALFPADVPAASCARLLPYLAFPAESDVEAFGSGAVVRRADGGYAILALDGDRRFKAVLTRGADVPPAPIAKADEYMAYSVAAIRRDACDEIVTNGLVYPNEKRSCRASAIRHLHAALDRAYTASPKRLGGDGRFAFYGIRVKPHYYTLVFMATSRDTYTLVASVEA